jgi:hypothetical protein
LCISLLFLDRCTYQKRARGYHVLLIVWNYHCVRCTYLKQARVYHVPLFVWNYDFVRCTYLKQAKGYNVPLFVSNYDSIRCLKKKEWECIILRRVHKLSFTQEIIVLETIFLWNRLSLRFPFIILINYNEEQIGKIISFPYG